MSDIKEKVKELTTKALKEKDEITLRTVRLLSTSVHNAEIDARGDLSEEEIMKLIQKEAKKRKDAIEIYAKAGDARRVDEETQELKILETFLPEQMSETEIEKIVDEVIDKVSAKTPSDIGRVMGPVMANVAGKADGKIVASIVTRKLS